MAGKQAQFIIVNARFKRVRGSSLLQIKIRIGHILRARNPRAQRCLARHAGRDRLEGETDRTHENNNCHFSASSSSAEDQLPRPRQTPINDLMCTRGFTGLYTATIFGRRIPQQSSIFYNENNNNNNNTKDNVIL